MQTDQCTTENFFVFGVMKTFLAFLLAFATVVTAIAQQPQNPFAPVVAVKAKYIQGSYDPTPGTGLVLNLGGGTVNCTGTIITYVAGTLTMSASTTNYVYLNTSSSCIPAVKTTSFTASDIPIAVVVTNSTAIVPTTGITDARASLQENAASGLANDSTARLAAAAALPVSGGTMNGTLRNLQNGNLTPSANPNIDAQQVGGNLTAYDGSEFTGTPLVMTTRFITGAPFTCTTGQVNLNIISFHVAATNGTITNPLGNLLAHLYLDNGSGAPSLTDVLVGSSAFSAIPDLYQVLNAASATNPYTVPVDTNVQYVSPIQTNYLPFGFNPYTCTPGTVYWPAFSWNAPTSGPAGDTLTVDTGNQSPTAPGISTTEYATSPDGITWTVHSGTSLWYQIYAQDNIPVSGITGASEAGAFWSQTQAAGQFISGSNNGVDCKSYESICALFDGALGGAQGISLNGPGVTGQSNYGNGVLGIMKSYRGAPLSKNVGESALVGESNLNGGGSYGNTGALLTLTRQDADYGAAALGGFTSWSWGATQSRYAQPIFSFQVGSGNVVTFNNFGTATGYTVTSNIVTFSISNPNFAGMIGLNFIVTGFSTTGACTLPNSVLGPLSPAYYQVVSTTGSTISAQALGYANTTCSSSGTLSFNAYPNYAPPGQTFVPSGLATTVGLLIDGQDFTIGTSGYGEGTFTATSSGFTHSTTSLTADIGIQTPDFSYPYTVHGCDMNRTNSFSLPGCFWNYDQDLTLPFSGSYQKLYDWQIRGKDEIWGTADAIEHASGFNAGGTPVTNTGNVATDANPVPALTIGALGAPATPSSTTSGNPNFCTPTCALPASTTYYYKVYGTTAAGGTTPGSAYKSQGTGTGSLQAITGVSGGSGFSGSGTIFLTAFNNGCTGTATVTLASGSFSSATITLSGSGCTAAPTSATCTSGSATCTGSPVSITVTSTISSNNANILYWTALPGSASYGICRSTSSGGTYLILASPIAATYYVDSGNVTPSGTCPSTDTSGGTLKLPGLPSKTCLATDGSGNVIDGSGGCSGSGSGTVSDGIGTSTPGQMAVSTSTPHVIGYTTAPTPGLQVICRQTVPWGNTGGVSATEDPTDCTIPANSMGANSFLVIHADVSSCTGSSAPWSGCTTNTGTCTASIYMSTTNTGSTLTVGTSTAIAATKQATMDSTVSNANSTSAQTVDAATMTGSNTIILTRALGSLNTTGTLYANFYMTNSVSGDHCFYDDYRVTLYQ
jgi:hypothetical protein